MEIHKNCKIEEVYKEAVKWYRQLHEYPELGFEEYQTSAFIIEKLKTFSDIEIRKIGKTGVLGILNSGTPGPCIAFRADIDALPIQECETHEPCSGRKGIMHACGHDAHTATLLAAAFLLSCQKERLKGEIRFLFQPSEEIQPGGAASMVEGGCLDGVDMIIGQHYSIDEAVGEFSICSGPSFAANNTFDITIHGVSAHAAFPQFGTDTLLIASQIIEMLNWIVPRHINVQSPALITVTRIHGGDSYNTIPSEVVIGGTIRFLDMEDGRKIIDLLKKYTYDICNMQGCSCEIRVTEGCAALCNDSGVEHAVLEIMRNKFGPEHILVHEPVMGCEDFSEYLKYVKGCYYRCGCQYIEADGTVFKTHHGGFHISERAIFYGIQGILEIIEKTPNMVEYAREEEEK